MPAGDAYEWSFVAVDAGRLLFSAGVVVKDAGLSAEQYRQLFQRRIGKAFVIPVQVVIAQHHREGIDLLCGEFAAAYRQLAAHQPAG